MNWSRRPSTCCAAITGRATFASWKTLCRAPACLNVGGPIQADELRDWLNSPTHRGRQEQGRGYPAGISLEAMERKLIEATLERFSGHRAKTAQALGIGLRTLSGKLKQYGYAPRAKNFSKVG